MAEKFKQFNALLQKSRKILVLTGAGVSAESGIPVFRGSGGFWRSYRSQDVATPQAFKTNPSLVWEFYHYRREVAFNAEPNAAHRALAAYEAACDAQAEGRELHVVTQNVDGLHQRAGSKRVIELHGALRQVICTNSKCRQVDINTDMPICPALSGRGDPSMKEDLAPIPVDMLPRCKKCGSLARPHIVWFGENLDRHVLDKARELVESCDLCVVVGTSSVVYPAAMFAPLAAERGVPVAEFNLDDVPASDAFNMAEQPDDMKLIKSAINLFQSSEEPDENRFQVPLSLSETIRVRSEIRSIERSELQDHVIKNQSSMDLDLHLPNALDRFQSSNRANYEQQPFNRDMPNG